MLAALESIPFLPDLLIGAGWGAFVGGVVSYLHQGRGGTISHDWLVTRWSAGVAVVALLVSVLAELL